MNENVKALRKALKARVKYDDGTIVRFALADGTKYKFAAIYITSKAAWFLTGRGWGGQCSFSDEEFLSLISAENASDVEVATAFESV